jgi:hypothetical protein
MKYLFEELETATIDRFHAMFPNIHFREVDPDKVCDRTPLWKACRSKEKLKHDIDGKHGMREIAGRIE